MFSCFQMLQMFQMLLSIRILLYILSDSGHKCIQDHYTCWMGNTSCTTVVRTDYPLLDLSAGEQDSYSLHTQTLANV